MIYGLNFNGTEIPKTMKRRFAETVKPFGMVKFRLQGVATTEHDRDQMLIQASNGTRQLHVEERKIIGGTWYGIYVY